jgi:tetratricopeptide (TPR) repeat protein
MSPARWGTYGSRGRAWLNLNASEHAVADFTESIRILSRNQNLNDFDLMSLSGEFFHRGNAWSIANIREGRARAINDFSEAIRLDPRNAAALAARGRQWLALGQRARAIADLNESIRLAPNDINSYFYRGIAHEESGDLTLALIDFRSVLRLFPNDPDARRSIARVESRIDALGNPRR